MHLMHRSYSVQEAVSETIDEMHFLHLPLQEDLINYSALARFIKPAVERKTGEEVGLEAIIMTLRKKSAEFGSKRRLDVFEAFKNAQVFLTTGMSLVRIAKTPETRKKLLEFQEKAYAMPGEQMFFIQQNEEISAIAPSKRIGELLSELGGQHVLSKSPKLALVTLIFSEKHLDAVGCIEQVGRQFADLNVSIAEIFSSHAKISAAFDETQAARVYEKFSKAIASSGEIAEMQPIVQEKA
ncbi:TPA: hypothetical protein HA244_01460 [Candidatus Micrarchaeota archaeon]|nr:hypothetical protein [Candidatus Micrarchaeota archaeon]